MTEHTAAADPSPLDALISTGRVRPATVRGAAPCRPTIPMRGGLDAGTLLQRMRALEIALAPAEPGRPRQHVVVSERS